MEESGNTIPGHFIKKRGIYMGSSLSKRIVAAVMCICMLLTGSVLTGTADFVTAYADSVVTITKQPVSVTVAEGTTAKVSLTATGDDLTYMWYFKDAGASSFSRTTSFTSNYYSVTMTSARAGRQVYCVVMDAYGNTAKTNTVTLNMSGEVTITKQPVSVTVASGATAKVSLTATGDDLTYIWYYKNAGDSKFTRTDSFTGNYYSVTMTSARAGRQVYCVVMDAYGNTAKSNTVTLNMSAASLAITKQPASVTVAEGDTAKVSLTATGSGLTYTWYYKSVGMSSFAKTTAFTGNTYYVEMNSSRDGRQVYCVVKDSSGNTVKSNTATLNMQHPVTITKQPVSVTAANGATAKVSFTATGDGLTYTWYYKSVGMSSFAKTTSFTGNSYSVIMNEDRAGRQVYCVVKDKYGNSKKTNTVTLNMASELKITKQPASVTVKEGATAKVSFTATGTGLTYTWYYKNAGASSFAKTTAFTGNSYAVEMNSSRSGRQLYCVVKDSAGNTVKTNTVTIKMAVPVKITKQPVSVAAASGETAKVSFTAEGDGLTYAWYFKNAGDSSFTKTASFTSNSYSVSMNSDRAGRQVYCVVTDKYGYTAKTNTVTLNMETAASDFEYKITDGKVSIRGYNGSSVNVSIPAYIEGYPVTSIYEDAFYKNSYIKTVTLPSTLTSIGYRAFSNCGALTTVSIPGSVTSIGSYAFNNCDALKNLTLSSGLKTIGSYAFKDCDALTSVTIPGTVTEINTEAFQSCSALSSLTFSSGVASIGSSAFYDCDALTAVTIPASVKTIGTEAFKSCDGLKTLTLKSGITSIGTYAFDDCSALGSVSIPGTVKTIGAYSFRNCDALKTVTLASGTTTIGSHAFDDCDALSAITVPGSVTKIDTYAFAGCGALKTVSITKGSDVSIESYAFNGCSAMTSLTLPASVVKIGTSAFENCDLLTSVTIPGSVTSMGTYAFYSCDNLTSVTVSSGVTSINDYAFYKCAKLSNVSLPSGLLTINYSAFRNTAIGSITIPSTVISIGGYAFANCDKLVSITIPGSVTTIGSYAFNDCDALTTAKMNSGLTKIESYAFSECNVLKTVSLPGSLTSIANSAFRDCDSLTGIVIPEGVTSVGDYCFYSCGVLASVKLPESLVSIGGSSCFKNCSASLTISVVDGSYSETWCANNGFSYTVR